MYEYMIGQTLDDCHMNLSDTKKQSQCPPFYRFVNLLKFTAAKANNFTGLHGCKVIQIVFYCCKISKNLVKVGRKAKKGR